RRRTPAATHGTPGRHRTRRRLRRDADRAAGLGPPLRRPGLRAAPAREKNGYDGSGQPCPGCGQSAAYHGDRGRSVLTPLGSVTLARAYYYCRRCGQGFAPFDQAAGLTGRGLDPALARLTTLAGAVADSFERA